MSYREMEKRNEQNYFCDTEHLFDMFVIFMSLSRCICNDPDCKNFPLDLQTSHKGSRSIFPENERIGIYIIYIKQTRKTCPE